MKINLNACRNIYLQYNFSHSLPSQNNFITCEEKEFTIIQR